MPIDKTRDLPIGIAAPSWASSSTTKWPSPGRPASILIYKTDVFHRGSDFKAPGRSRFVMPVDFKPRGWRWQGKLAWPDHATTQN